MSAQIEGERRRAGLPPKQKSDRRRAWRAALQCFQDGATQCSGAVLFHQLHQLGCLRAGRFALREGQIEKCLALRYGDLQAPTGRGVECLALDFEHRFLMSRIENQLVAVIGAHMASYLDSAIENAHTVSGSGQDQLPADCLRGNGVIVEIETNIDALAGADAFDSVSRERMQSLWQQSRLLFDKDIGDRTVVAARPAPLVRDLIAPEKSLAIALGQRGESAAGPEGVAYVPDS